MACLYDKTFSTLHSHFCSKKLKRETKPLPVFAIIGHTFEVSKNEITLYQDNHAAVKNSAAACFAQAKDADGMFCLGKRSQWQPSPNHICNQICVETRLIDT